jgi:putative permease
MTVPSQSSLPKLRQISLSIFVVLGLVILSGLRFPILHQVFQEWPKLHAATATFVALCIGVIPVYSSWFYGISNSGDNDDA